GERVVLDAVGRRIVGGHGVAGRDRQAVGPGRRRSGHGHPQRGGHQRRHAGAAADSPLPWGVHRSLVSARHGPIPTREMSDRRRLVGMTSFAPPLSCTCHTAVTEPPRSLPSGRGPAAGGGPRPPPPTGRRGGRRPPPPTTPGPAPPRRPAAVPGRSGGPRSTSSTGRRPTRRP